MGHGITMNEKIKKIIRALSVVNGVVWGVFLIGIAIILVMPLGDITDASVGNTTADTVLSNESLVEFLINDTTEDQYYEYQVHDCMDFSIELAHNLTDAGYDTGVVEQLATARGVPCGHVMTWVRFGNYTVYIEPQSDQIYTPEQYTNLFDTKKYALVETPTINMVIKRAGYRTGYGIRKACLKYGLLY